MFKKTSSFNFENMLYKLKLYLIKRKKSKGLIISIEEENYIKQAEKYFCLCKLLSDNKKHNKLYKKIDKEFNKY
jgi:hypothetical protein